MDRKGRNWDKEEIFGSGWSIRSYICLTRLLVYDNAGLVWRTFNSHDRKAVNGLSHRSGKTIMWRVRGWMGWVSRQWRWDPMSAHVSLRRWKQEARSRQDLWFVFPLYPWNDLQPTIFHSCDSFGIKKRDTEKRVPSCWPPHVLHLCQRT